MDAPDSHSEPLPAAPGSSDAAWDAFVARCVNGSYLQASAWAAVKAPNGWTSARVTADAGDGGTIGAQLLLRRPRPLPWAFAYAPRGPVATSWSAAAVGRFTDTLRAASLGRVSHVRIDPEIEAGGPLDPEGSVAAALRAAGWQPTRPVQPASTRVIDLAVGEAALWSALRKKWRQYVNKARTAGVTVIDGGDDPIEPFYRIYRETADRAGFLIRTERAYRDVWEAFRPSGDARMLFAVDGDGAPQAALFLVHNGSRVIEPYGGMTGTGADLRANYLLKWEAIRGSAEAGATSYDLWGLAQPGIAHFKAGFGGREVRYIGGFDLVLSGLGRRIYGGAQAARVVVARRRAGLPPATEAPTGAPAGADATDPSDATDGTDASGAPATGGDAPA
jgi:lipid II:glycine glycyltransferase (peptidoglycan interpeptide bridge formation enzyme)